VLAATGVRTGGFAGVAAWPKPDREVLAIKTKMLTIVRIGIP